MGALALANRKMVHDRGSPPESVIGHQRHVSVADVERRIIRACRTLRALPDHERKFQMMPNPWPDTVREVSEAYGYDEQGMPKFRPSPADVSDCLIALNWARALEKREFKLIWWRSFNISFRYMGLRLGRSDETARMRYRDALLRLWMEAASSTSRTHVVSGTGG